MLFYIKNLYYLFYIIYVAFLTKMRSFSVFWNMLRVYKWSVERKLQSHNVWIMFIYAFAKRLKSDSKLSVRRCISVYWAYSE